MTTRIGGLLAVLLVATVGLTACGDDKDDTVADPQHDKAVSAFSKRLYLDNRIDKLTELLSHKEADCVAASVVDDLGADKLVKMKVLSKDLAKATLPDSPPKELATPQIDATSECVGLVEFWMRSALELTKIAVKANPDGPKKPPSEKEWARATACVEKHVSEAQMKKAMLAGLDDPAAVKRMIAPKIAPCEKQFD